MASQPPPPGPWRDSEALASPQPLNALVVHPPPLTEQQAMDAAVAISGMRAREPPHIPQQLELIAGNSWLAPLRRSGLPDEATRRPLAHQVRLHRVLDGVPPPRRAQKFPSARSFSTWLSKACFATRRFSAAFSRSRSFRRFISGPFMPPY